MAHNIFSVQIRLNRRKEEGQSVSSFAFLEFRAISEGMFSITSDTFMVTITLIIVTRSIGLIPGTPFVGHLFIRKVNEFFADGLIC